MRNGPNAANFGRLNFPPIRRVHVQALVHAVAVVVFEVVFQDSLEMGLAKDDYVVKNIRDGQYTSPYTKSHFKPRRECF